MVCGELIEVLTGTPWLRAAARVNTLNVEPADTPVPPPWAESAARLMVVCRLPGPNRLLTPRARTLPVPGSTIASAPTRLPDGGTCPRSDLSTAFWVFMSSVVRTM